MIDMKKKNKKAVSPIVSTVLLITICIVLALIILLWSKGFIKETIEKEIAGETKNIDKACSEIYITPIINTETQSFGFTNSGNVPIYAFNLKLSSNGNSEITKISSVDGGLVNPGFSTIIKDAAGNAYDYDIYEEIKIIPILLGKSKSGGIQEYQCSEKDSLIIKTI